MPGGSTLKTTISLGSLPNCPSECYTFVLTIIFLQSHKVPYFVALLAPNLGARPLCGDGKFSAFRRASGPGCLALLCSSRCEQTTDLYVAHPPPHISDDSESLYYLVLAPMITVAMPSVPGDRSRVHTYDHDGSEAPDESLDSTLSSEPKPLGNKAILLPIRPYSHPKIILSPQEVNLTACESHSTRCDIRDLQSRSSSSLAVELSPTSYLEPRVDKYNLLRSLLKLTEYHPYRSTGVWYDRDGGKGR
ncbi:hypothetical protein Tco_0321017 [Tanacetum coccineum]